jgi:cytochrome c oxidase subunit 2
MTEVLWGWPPPVLDPAGPYAESVTVLAWVLFAMGVFVTGVVVAALWIALRGPDRLKAKIGGEKVIWIGGIAFPAVVLTALLIWGLALTASLTKPITGEEMRIRVTGEMWWFRVEYLGPDGEIVMEDANEVHIPVGEPVVFELTSADVIHSFWVPHLSGKKDMIPGRTTLLRVEADRAGRFGGVCAEYCGGPHALMGFVAVAHEPDDWAEWLASRTAPTEEPAEIAQASEIDLPSALPVAEGPLAVRAEGDAARGRELFMESGCAACHRVAGTEATGRAGPDLTHVGSRLTLGAGILPNHRGTLIGWIGDSQSIKPGNRMPSYDLLPAEDIDAIAAWLEQQR